MLHNPGSHMCKCTDRLIGMILIQDCCQTGGVCCWSGDYSLTAAVMSAAPRCMRPATVVTPKYCRPWLRRGATCVCTTARGARCATGPSVTPTTRSGARWSSTSRRRATSRWRTPAATFYRSSPVSTSGEYRSRECGSSSIRSKPPVIKSIMKRIY